MSNRVGVIYRANGDNNNVSPKNGTDFSLSEMQDIVGGYIEFIYSGSQVIVINEEGKINNLPLNEVVTEQFQAAHNTRDFIVGDALVCPIEMVK